MIVVFDAPGSPAVVAEVAKTDLEREVGLSLMDDLADGRGMLFLFDQPQQLKMTMAQTPMGLDMVFISSDGVVVDVVDAPALWPFPLGPQTEAQYVLEVVRGWAKANEVKAGNRVLFIEGDVE